MIMQGYCDVYKWTSLKRTSPEVKCLHPTSSRREMCTLSVSNVIYHKFSHGAAFYTLNGKNVNVMLEYIFSFQLSTLEEDFIYAAEFGDIPTVQRILDENPHLNVDFSDILGRTPLRLAVGNEHLEVTVTKTIFFFY